LKKEGKSYRRIGQCRKPQDQQHVADVAAHDVANRKIGTARKT